MNNLYDLFCRIDEYTEYIQTKGFEISENGLPVFTRDMFLDENPELLIPVDHWKDRRIRDKKKTVIVFFCGDKAIYRRLDKLLAEIDIYRQFMGVAGMDVTVTSDMDLEWQRAVLHLNHLAMAVLACSGIKIVLNSRTGGPGTESIFDHIPKGITVASGFLGCNSAYQENDYSYISKMLKLIPNRILIYGSCNAKARKQLDMMGMSYKVFKDFRQLCKEAS